MINSDRLSRRFVTFAQTDSLSRQEGQIAGKLEKILKGMGAEVIFDNAGEKVGGDCGNLVAKFKGTVDGEPLFLSGHMDTVEPGRGVKVLFKDGVFTSDGTTILGADDKSALAIILEVMEVIFENNLPYPPIEVVFTICEEIGLLGAKHFDYSLLDSKIGYILDSTDTDGVVTQAPASTKFTISIHGRASHAGAEPEHGISAISVAARAINSLTLGRIDHETTCNIGKIQGGKATNIIPEFTSVDGEARSHDAQKLKSITDTMIKAFYDAATAFRREGETLPRIEVNLDQDYPATNIPEEHEVVVLAKKAAQNLGRPMESKRIGGGADANIFFSKNIVAGVLGTGMTAVHTVKESIRLSDMVNTAEVLLEIISIKAAGQSVINDDNQAGPQVEAGKTNI
ncbi:MAG: M20/M25/M40 family metallo-hydrolase [Desulfobacterium sp.]|nr:M20/M25/M40 family metallo-hydrolase [Desulfobacterium sp.]